MRGVYSMGIFFAVFVVIVSVISRSGYAHIGNLQYGLQFLVYGERVVYRLLIPMRHKLFFGFSPRTTTSPPISTMKLPIAFLFQQLRNDIYCIAFGYGAARKHDAGILFDNFSVGG